MKITPKNSRSRCQSLAKSGKPCKAAATEGGLCFFHANPKKAVELGRLGGRKKRIAASGNAAPLPKLDSVIAVQETVSRLIAEVFEGKLDPKIASGLAPLLSLQMRVIEANLAAELDRRLAKLEKLEEKARAKDDSGPASVPPLVAHSFPPASLGRRAQSQAALRHRPVLPP